MRWFARRLVFYVFAIWVALTLNFLLPRLMPGNPIAGLLQHLCPAQLPANPGIIQTYEALLGGGQHSLWHDYVVYLHRIAHFNFGISTSNYPAPVSEVIGRTLPYSIFLVGVAFLLAFLIGTASGCSPPGGAAASSTTSSCRSSWRSARFRRSSSRCSASTSSG